MRQSGSFDADTLKAFQLWRVWTYLAISDLKVRYSRTMLGFGWLLITFAVWAAGVGFVYARLFNLPASEFVPFLAIGFALWGFLTSSFVDSSNALLGAAGYIKQFNLPKQVYVLRTFVTQIISLGLSFIVCLIVLAVFGKLSFLGLFFAIPGIVILLGCALLHSFISSYLTPYLRDFPHAVGSLLSVIFFLTPIIFPVSMLKERGLDFIYKFNPFYYLIDAVRAPLIEHSWPAAGVLMGAISYFILLVVLARILCGMLDRRLVYSL